MASINELIELGEWNVLRQKLQNKLYNKKSDDQDEHNCDDTMTVLNKDGMSPLHLASSKRNVPQDMIHMLFQLDKEALRRESSYSMSLPLHYACESGSASTVQTLLQLAYYNSPPSEDNESKSSILQYYNTSLDINQRTPLERAWLAYLYPDCDQKDEYPATDDSNDNETITMTPNLFDLWTKTEYILYAVNKNKVDFTSRYNATNSGNQWYILHEIARSGGGDKCWCPSIVMWFGLRLGFAYQIYKFDEAGDLPLHVAAKCPTHKILFVASSPVIATSKQHNTNDVNTNVLEMLIEKFPSACQIPNKEKNLALHLAIKTGKRRKDGIDLICKSYPNSINMTDSKTKLNPFLLAACGTNGNNDCNSDAPKPNKSSSLDLTFELLRANPNHIKRGDIKRAISSKKRIREMYVEEPRRKKVQRLC